MQPEISFALFMFTIVSCWLLLMHAPARIGRRYRAWRSARGLRRCARGEHAWVDRPPQGDEWLLPWLRPVRCSRCNVRARLTGMYM